MVKEIDGLIPKIPTSEKISLGGGLNGHIGISSKGYKRIHRGQGFG